MCDPDPVEQIALTSWTRAMRAVHEEDLRSEVDWISPMSVYADALQSVGDIRGDLIALDLWDMKRSRMERDRAPHEKRDGLATAWLAELSQHPDIRHRFGLLRFKLTDDSYELLERVLNSPSGRYVEALRVHGSIRLLNRALQRILDYGRLPWLGRLSISVRGNSLQDEYAVSGSWADRLAACAPNLHTLEVEGHHVLDHFSHQQLTHLVVTGHSSLGSLVYGGAVCPSVASLDFAFHAVDATGVQIVPVPLEVLNKLLPVSQFPRVKRLDLSRNEPGYQRPTHLGGAVDIFGFVKSLDLLEKVDRLRLPTLRTPADSQSMQSCLDRLSSAARVEVRDCYVPNLTFECNLEQFDIPLGKHWIPRDEVNPDTVLHVTFGNTVHRASLLELCSVMERQYYSLDAAARSLWDFLWLHIRSLIAKAHNEIDVPTDLLGSAIESCGSYFVDDSWSRFVQDVSELRSFATATIRLDMRERDVDV